MNDLIRYDLVLKGGRVVDPAQGLDKVTDIAFSGGKVAAIGDNLQGKDIRPVAGRIVVPGLIDLHTHVYWGGTSLGVEAELLAQWQKRCSYQVQNHQSGDLEIYRIVGNAECLLCMHFQEVLVQHHQK